MVTVSSSLGDRLVLEVNDVLLKENLCLDTINSIYKLIFYNEKVYGSNFHFSY